MAVEYTPADVERRLNAGEWLGISPLAVLFGVDRSTFHRWVTKHELVRSRPSSPAGGTAPLLCNPDDVKALLARHRGQLPPAAGMSPGE